MDFIRLLVARLLKRLGLAQSVRINTASATALRRAIPGLDEVVAGRIWREAQRSPFQDLVDVQFRCQLKEREVRWLLTCRIHYDRP